MSWDERIGWGRRLTIAIPYLWLGVFFLLPFLIVLRISVSTYAIAQPPFAPAWDSLDAVLAHLSAPDWANYALLFDDPLYRESVLNSLRIAGVSTLVALLIGYPMAYGMARSRPRMRAVLLTLVILPFWTSLLIRVYSWIGILKTEGVLNALLLGSGLITEPLTIHLTPLAVYIGVVYTYLPFMVLPLYASLEKLDLSLLEAASDLGARPLTVFRRVVLPMSLPGVAAGCNPIASLTFR